MNDKSHPDYYPRIKINERWYLIVPELHVGAHNGCAFYQPESVNECRLCTRASRNPEALDGWERFDCGDHETIFVAPSKFQKYLSERVSIRMNEGDDDA